MSLITIETMEYTEYKHSVYYEILTEIMMLLPFYISDETLQTHVYPFFYDIYSKSSNITLYQILQNAMYRNEQLFRLFYKEMIIIPGGTTQDQDQELDLDNESIVEFFAQYFRNLFFTFPTHWQEMIQCLCLQQPFYKSFVDYFDCIDYDIQNSSRTTTPYFKITRNQESDDDSYYLDIMITDNAVACHCQTYMVCDDDAMVAPPIECVICMEIKEKKDMVTFGCSHFICIECCTQHFDAQFDQLLNRGYTDISGIHIVFTCPYCRAKVDAIDVYSVSSYKELNIYEKWKPLHIPIPNSILKEYCWKLIYSRTETKAIED